MSSYRTAAPGVPHSSLQRIASIAIMRERQAQTSPSAIGDTLMPSLPQQAVTACLNRGVLLGHSTTESFPSRYGAASVDHAFTTCQSRPAASPLLHQQRYQPQR
jgi:hypothetical protein